MNKLSRYLKKEQGFSLIELLIVIAILALLAMLIIPRLTTSLDSAQLTTDQANVKLLQSAVERYYFDKGEYPTTGGGDSGDIDCGKLVAEKYIDEAPKDPWDNGRNYKLVDGVVQALGKP